MRILGIDPGIRNCAYSVINHRGQLIASGMIKHTITELRTPGLKDSLVAFGREVQKLIKRHGVTNMVAERFISRGLKGSQGEMISMMLGHLVFHHDCHLLLSSTWKNQVNKQFDLKAAYRAYGLVPHIIDASLIATYYADLLTCRQRAERAAVSEVAKGNSRKKTKLGKKRITNQIVVRSKVTEVKVQGPGLLLSNRKRIIQLLEELEACHKSRNPRDQANLLRAFKQSFVH
jgi:hypothetical protein